MSGKIRAGMKVTPAENRVNDTKDPVSLDFGKDSAVVLGKFPPAIIYLCYTVVQPRMTLCDCRGVCKKRNDLHGIVSRD